MDVFTMTTEDFSEYLKAFEVREVKRKIEEEKNAITAHQEELKRWEKRLAELEK